MSLPLFFLSVILISLSGVMAPGPITAATIAHGNRSPNAGILIAVGHGIVEFPLMILIALGFGELVKTPSVSASIAIAGEGVLIYMGFRMLKAYRNKISNVNQVSRTPLMAGIMLSIGNPYFIIWWATVGATLVITAVKFGIVVFFLFAITHWSIDLIWYYTLSLTTFKASSIWGEKFSKLVFVFCGAILVFFGGMFIYYAFQTIHSIV